MIRVHVPWRHVRIFTVIALCLLAFGLRVFRLDAQSLWYDEGLGVHFASLPPQVAASQGAVTEHPPLYALLLGAWMRTAGRSEFAVRFVSLWWSVLAAALTWRLGRELLTDAIGAVGALFVAASAFAVWYAQEARGYSMLLALTLITTWAFVRLFCHSESQHLHLRRAAGTVQASGQESRPCKAETIRSAQGGGWAWVALIASGVAALYTHYYAAFTLLALNLSFLAVLACWSVPKALPRAVPPSQDTRLLSRIAVRASRFWLSQLVILAGFAPWLPAAIQQATTNTTYFPGRVGWQTVVEDTLRTFATGDAAPTFLASVALCAMGALAIVGAFAERRGTMRLNRVIAALLVAVPLAAMAVIAWQKPKFAPRYLIEALPAFYLLVGAGFTTLWGLALRPSQPTTGPTDNARLASIDHGRGGFAGLVRQLTVGRALAIICAGVLVCTGALSLQATYFDPARQRPDLRGVAAYIATNEQPGDVIALLSGHQWPPFMLYYHGENPVVPMPEGILPPVQSPLDYRAARRLEDIARGRSRLWLVLWQRELADPTDVVTSELMGKARRLSVGQDFHDMRLLLFDLRDHAPFGDGPQHATDWRFAQPIALAGYDLSAVIRAPGESVDLALYWRASGPIAGDYQVFTHLLAPDGHMVAGSDHIAGADNYPTSLWTDGTLIRNMFALRIPPDAPPGIYYIEVGLYGDPREPLKLVDETDRILLAQIVVR